MPGKSFQNKIYPKKTFFSPTSRVKKVQLSVFYFEKNLFINALFIYPFPRLNNQANSINNTIEYYYFTFALIKSSYACKNRFRDKKA